MPNEFYLVGTSYSYNINIKFLIVGYFIRKLKGNMGSSAVKMMTLKEITQDSYTKVDI